MPRRRSRRHHSRVPPRTRPVRVSTARDRSPFSIATRASCGLGEHRRQVVARRPQRRVGLAQHRLGLVQQLSADEHLAEVRRGMCRLGRVSDALELLERVAVQLGRLPPSSLRVGLHAEVHLRHCGRPRRPEAAEHIHRPLLEHGFLRLTDVEVAAVQGRVGAREGDARPEWLGLLDHPVRRLDRVTRPCPAAGRSAPAGRGGCGSRPSHPASPVT